MDKSEFNDHVTSEYLIFDSIRSLGTLAGDYRFVAYIGDVSVYASAPENGQFIMKEVTIDNKNYVAVHWEDNDDASYTLVYIYPAVSLAYLVYEN